MPIIKPNSHWLGKLYDEVSRHTDDDPAILVRDLAQIAFKQGSLDEPKMTALQHRFPLPGFERLNLRETGALVGVAHDTVSRYENIIYKKLKAVLEDLLEERKK